MMKFYEKHKDQRDRFEVLAIHDTSMKEFASLDAELKKLKEKRWDGKDLPFPILLDSSGETMEAYKVQALPTTVLIDPDGKIAQVEVGHRGRITKTLEAKLTEPKTPADKKPAEPKPDSPEAPKPKDPRRP